MGTCARFWDIGCLPPVLLRRQNHDYTKVGIWPLRTSADCEASSKRSAGDSGQVERMLACSHIIRVISKIDYTCLHVFITQNQASKALIRIFPGSEFDCQPGLADTTPQGSCAKDAISSDPMLPNFIRINQFMGSLCREQAQY